MPDVIISDTSTLILFKKIDEFQLLRQVYRNLLITPEIAYEFQEPLPDWIQIQAVSDTKYQDFLETQIDKGEASVLSLASEFNQPLLLLDDLKARKLAKNLNFNITGTLGIINKEKSLRLIDAVKPIIEKILLTDFRIAGGIVKELLKLNNED